jgi:hypothetical protein
MLRGPPTAGGFIERWIDQIIFYDAPAWVFTMAYIAFAALVLVTWFVVPPIRQRGMSRLTGYQHACLTRTVLSAAGGSGGRLRMLG